MKTRQEQIEAVLGVIHRKMRKTTGFATTTDIATALVRAGYGDVSEYKAEIKRLKEEIDYFDEFVRRVDDIRWNVMGESVTTCKTLLRYIEIEKKQAQIDVLNKLKERIGTAIDTYYNSDGGGYYLAEDALDDIDLLIEEAKQ